MSLDNCKTPVKKLLTIAVTCTADLISPARRLLKFRFTYHSAALRSPNYGCLLSCRTTSPPDGSLFG